MHAIQKFLGNPNRSTRLLSGLANIRGSVVCIINVFKPVPNISNWKLIHILDG